MVPDSYGPLSSGGTAAQEAARILREMGYNTGVYASRVRQLISDPDGDGIAFFQRGNYRVLNHLYGGATLSEFEQVLDNFRPSHVFFLGASMNKPATFFKACRRRDAYEL